MANSLTDQEIEKILKERRIKNKIVILCEGEPFPISIKTPGKYAQMEQFPDANFYKACIPCNWTQNLPVFYNCGSRGQVIKAYFQLLDLHNSNPQDSYLDPNKLYALVDSDIQKSQIDGYPFSNTEKIRNDLYSEINIQSQNLINHKIFVTGLIHKEAYFLIPECQSIFDNWKNELSFEGAKFNLESLYMKMINDIENDADLSNDENFSTVKDRLSFLIDLDTNSKTKIKESWLNLYKNTDDQTKLKLIYSLLSIRKSKNYWIQIESSDWTGNKSAKRDDLSIQIANFISSQTEKRFHLIHIFNFLRSL